MKTKFINILTKWFVILYNNVLKNYSSKKIKYLFGHIMALPVGNIVVFIELEDHTLIKLYTVQGQPGLI